MVPVIVSLPEGVVGFLPETFILPFISTILLSSPPITTFPVWGIFLYVPSSLGANPNPSEPIEQLECMIQLFPIVVSFKIFVPG